MTNTNLLELFKFTPADLQANRRGQLSAAQQARWAEAEQWAGSMTTTIIPLIFSLFVAVTGIIISLVVDQFFLGSLLSLAAAAVAGGGLRLRLRPTAPPEPLQPAATVHRAEGIIHLKETLDDSEHGLSRRYKLEIDHHTFPLFRREQFESLENGARYIIYYLDDDQKYIVSLEKEN